MVKRGMTNHHVVTLGTRFSTKKLAMFHSIHMHKTIVSLKQKKVFIQNMFLSHSFKDALGQYLTVSVGL